MCPCAQSRSGFTLVELMIVLVLIGIFSGLMLAEMRGTFEDALLRSTARKIISAANLASSEAVTVNKPCAVWITPGENQVKVQLEAQSQTLENVSLDARITVSVREGLQAPSQDEAEPTERSMPPTLDKIVFFPDGTADNREILLRDRIGVELLLRIDPITGRIRALDNEVRE
jgi:type II secretion system protein H